MKRLVLSLLPACQVVFPLPSHDIEDVEPNLMFVTSTAQPPGQLGGLDGADQLCATRAAAGGLDGTYKAWMSTSTVDAADRLGDASGWLRPDGKPMAASAADLLVGKLLFPPRIDELHGDHDDVLAYVVTGTKDNGTVVEMSTCADYTGTQSVTVGLAHAGTQNWTFATGINCDTLEARVYCFGIDRTAVLPSPVVDGRLAFVSSEPFQPGGGIADADALCAGEASEAGLQGTFQALLATTSATAASRFSTSGPGWVRPDGVPVTSDLVKLTAPIDVTAGTQYRAFSNVWTGAASTGELGTVSTTCSDWTSALGSGLQGNSMRTSTEWFKLEGGAGPGPCNLTSTHVYCFQQ